MAKRTRSIRVTFVNGDTKVYDIGKTATERYIRRFLSDLILPYPVRSWVVI